MIRVKITPMGGYICGDGDIPNGLNPDQFMKLFMGKIMAAKMQGLTELGIEQYEIDDMIARTQFEIDNMFDQTPEYLMERDASTEEIMNHVGNAIAVVDRENNLLEDRV
jgi:hypothetical protein